MTDKYTPLEKKIGIHIENRKLFANVFVHRSYLNEHKNSANPSNERLEFLGDSVLSLITSVYLFKKYHELAEGDYTEIKSSIVKTESLAAAASVLDLGDYLFLSKGEELGGGRNNKNILADCFEALIACIFLDQSFETAFEFVSKHLFKETLDEVVENKSYLSAKSKLQELIQGRYKITPIYKVLEEKGPEHKRTFKVGVFFHNRKLGTGTASSKKEAEEIAAGNAFENIKAI